MPPHASTCLLMPICRHTSTFWPALPVTQQRSMSHSPGSTTPSDAAHARNASGNAPAQHAAPSPDHPLPGATAQQGAATPPQGSTTPHAAIPLPERADRQHAATPTQRDAAMQHKAASLAQPTDVKHAAHHRAQGDVAQRTSPPHPQDPATQHRAAPPALLTKLTQAQPPLAHDVGVQYACRLPPAMAAPSPPRHARSRKVLLRLPLLHPTAVWWCRGPHPGSTIIQAQVFVCGHWHAWYVMHACGDGWRLPCSEVKIPHRQATLVTWVQLFPAFSWIPRTKLLPPDVLLAAASANPPGTLLSSHLSHTAFHRSTELPCRPDPVNFSPCADTPEYVLAISHSN